MKFRVFSLFLIIIIGTSCKFFSLKKKTHLQEIDTIINFSSVDSSPMFLVCKDLIDKDKKSLCFSKTIYNELSKSFSQYKIEVRKPVNEEINVVVIIDSKGKATVKEIISSSLIKESIQNIDSLIKACVGKLPTLLPATKRGIPVTTQYQIPIQISVK